MCIKNKRDVVHRSSHLFRAFGSFLCKLHTSVDWVSSANTQSKQPHLLNFNSGELFQCFPVPVHLISMEGHGIGEVDKENVGDRLKIVRIKAGMSQAQFAREIGYGKMQVHCAEHGKVNPSNELLRSASMVFDVSYEWLLTGQGEMKAEKAVVGKDLIEWLEHNPDILRELRRRARLD